MNKENEKTYLHDLRCDSYITKDELINMISNIHFEYVKHLNMDLITGYIIKNNPDNPNDQDIKPLYYTINIE